MPHPIGPVLHPAAVAIAARRPRPNEFLMTTAVSGPGIKVASNATPAKATSVVNMRQR
jgi:hypothetical protein